MQIPQALPARSVDLRTRDSVELRTAQPERGREYVQIRPGEFRASLRERSNGVIALSCERWSSPVRVRCARPRSYIAFSAVEADPPAKWCAVELAAQSLLEIESDWELTTRGPFTAWSFAVELSRLEAAEANLAGSDGGCHRRENRVLRTPSNGAVAADLRRRVESGLSTAALPPAAQSALEDDLVHLAVRLRSWGRLSLARSESPSRRRRAVRRIEEYLEAHEREVPSLAELCAVAGVSERTLEYAFREQIGASPSRYLRMRRLNGVHSDLLHAESGTTRVTDVAMGWGFWELGRFAVEYRALFGERPSKTLEYRGRKQAEREAAP